MSNFIEWLPATKYYHRRTPGWVVLANGSPHHVESKRAALKYAASFI